MLLRIVSLWIASATLAVAAPALDAPATAKIGGEISITVSGSSNARDFVTIVPKGTREGAYQAYEYVDKPGVLTLRLAPQPGDYEIRLLGAATPYPTLARRALKLEAVVATVDGPAQVAAGAKFQVRWTGPANTRDYVGIGSLEPGATPYLTYEYAREGNPLSFTAPDKAGDYELRYFLGNGDKVIGSKRFTVGSVSASVSVPAQVGAGARFSVAWKGPNNARDFITMVKAGTPEKRYERYEYTSAGNPLELRAPDQPGEYEVRYLTAQSYATLASTKITVGAISASLQAPAEAVGGSSIAVRWKGPNNPGEYITLVAKGAHDGDSGSYAYTAEGNPANLRAPIVPGEYELRYSTGQTHATLARAAIRITPAKEEPGFVSANAATATGNAVEIILDASGSMLQRIGSQRRIDIAKQTLTKLTSTTLPAGTPFALRVFGRELDSCQTDLEIPLSPLNAGAVAAKIAALEVKNNAKTPIGASLEKAASDLSGVKGERLVVLLTDGEETCGGDPAAAIEKLKQGGIAIRVNIVGFAIDDAALAATFRHWADAGNGAYFNAKDAAGLNDALAQSMRPSFQVVNAQGQVIAEGLMGGEKVRVMPGNYTLRIKGQPNRTKPVAVRSKETATVSF